MDPAPIRRLALVAAILLLVPLWSRPSTAARSVDSTAAAVVRVAPTAAASSPAIRRQASGGWWVTGTRLDPGRTLLGLGLVVLLSLLRVVRWDTIDAARWALSPLVRRRHIIALRAPPHRFTWYQS